jgi:hypothetical protein
MTTVLHLEYGYIWNQFGDRPRSIEKYIAVVDSRNHERRRAQGSPVLIRNSISVVDLGVEQRQDMRHRLLHIGPAVERKPRRNEIVPNLLFVVKQAFEDLPDTIPCRIRGCRGSATFYVALDWPCRKVSGRGKQNKPFDILRMGSIAKRLDCSRAQTTASC